ncbi:MAG: DUF1800 family protein, partial [Verrucomicrobia bacterium]|nr:DUF1800 family protein [Verrucomicrobiota bacterium]
DLLEESEPVVAQVVRPADDALIAGGPCAMPGALGDAPESLAPLRPHRFGTRQPKAAPRAGTWSERAVLMPSNDPAWCLPLVVPAAGRYQLMLRAQGDQAVGALPSVALYLNDAEQPVTLARLVHAGWHRLPLGAPVKLDAGPAVLTVQFKNDFAHGKEDRNLYLDRFELMRIDGSAEETGKPAGVVLINNNVAAPSPPASPSQTPVLNRNPPPSALAVALLYPRNGQDIFGTDAVIARVNANAGSGDATARPLAWADVLLDGQPLGVRLENPPPGQPLVFPLPARGLVGNGHHLAVRAAEAGANAGLTTDSPAQLVNFLPAPPPAAAPGPYERALRLLDRFGYGPEPRELTAILTQGEAAWLDARLRESADNPRENALHALAVTRYPKLDDGGQTVARALLQAMATDNPVRARFTAWVENHFSTWLNKTGPALKWQEHRAFHRLGIAPFADLLNVSAHSPAMLVYLDQEKSFANKLNENYAREIMELHTLGVHGGYAQADVTALAGLLNGWTLAEEARVPLADEEAMQINNKNESGLEKEFRFDPALNDGRPRRIFGLDFDAAPDPWDRYDRVRFALEMLVAHPATAEHVCRKLAAHYVGSPPPEALVRDLARVFLENGGDLRVVLRALAAHPLFWSAPPRLATPQDYALRLTRLLRAADPTPDGAKSPKPEQVNDFMRKSGMGLFDRATPDGYPEGDANYSDSNALLQRWRFAQNQAGALLALVPAAWRQPPVPGEGSTLPAVDPAQRIIDLAAIRLTGRLLTPGSNAAARELLGDAPKPEQVQAAIVFVALLPEANLR